MNPTKLKLIAGLLSLAAGTLVSYSAFAGPLDPNCDPERVAKNAAMKATVGVEGRCTPEKAAERKVDDAKDAVGDVKDNVSDSVSDKVDNVKPEKKEVKDAGKVIKKVVN